MASAIEQRTESFFKRPLDEKLIPVPKEATGLATLGPGAGAMTDVPFSIFIPEHQKKALQVTAELMHIANANPGEEGLEKVLDRVEEEAATNGVELAQYALSVFITHHPRGRGLPIPRLEETNPELVKPSKEAQGGIVTLGATGTEAALDWYREDASANDHHLRWHRVYPGGGHPDPADPDMNVTADRQGELFLYMHEQMLARYDTERLGAGLDKAESLSDYRTEVPEGYIPNLPPFNDRQPDSLMTDSTFAGASVVDLETWDKEIFGEIKDNDAAAFAPQGNRGTPDLIGCTIESNIGAVDRNRFGDLHNAGHVVIAFIPDPNGVGQQFGGVMRSVRVAIRDPIFYRWHRHIDDAHALWQDKQPAQKFDDAPKKVTANDIIVAGASKVGADAEKFGNDNFGGAKFGSDPAQSGVATDTLNTFMRKRTIGGAPVTFLDHDDFYFFIRATNDTGAAKTVTVRVFLVAEEWIEDRRRWIELDKFQHSLAAGKSVIARSSKLAAVARKPARRPDEPQAAAGPNDNPDYCDCGWPYHLLLPRGKRAPGMKFRLMAMFTDWEIDKVEVAGKCSSMSFCGKMNAPYPDRRPMGYPFDRKWSGKIADTIDQQATMTARKITIQWIDPPGP